MHTQLCTPGAQSRRGPGLSAHDLLPASLVHELSRHFIPSRVEYIAHVLSADELCVISDLSDALIVARIKRMSNQRLKHFDNLVPIDNRQQRHYQSLQLQWLRDEEYLLGTRLGRSPTQKELFIDFMKNHNGLRFRAFFTLKFPHKMKPKSPAALRC
jgi:hypothetical protein